MSTAFRFMATLPSPRHGMAAWGSEIRRLEEAGFDTVAAADHFTGGWTVEPLVALTAASAASHVLRLQTNVLSNDYRHPVLVHRMAATLDVVSDGRFELGMGGGWMVSDYETAGIPLDRPGLRIDRLAESVKVVKGLFGPEPFTFEGEHYRIKELLGVPAPVQRPRPPLFIGGGAPRVLRLAGREADIVGIHANLGAGRVSAEVVAEMTPERVAEKVGWVRSAAEKAGRDFGALELHMNFRFCAVERSEGLARRRLSDYAQAWGVPVEVLERSPQVLWGTPDTCAEELLARRAAFGISYFHFDPGPVAAEDIDGYAEVMTLARKLDAEGATCSTR